jgi:hypothetical protein
MHGVMIACGTVTAPPDHPWFGKCLCRHRDQPPWNPGKWNKPPTQKLNNCYNYACDLPNNTFAVPGFGAGYVITAISCAEVIRGAVKDGLSEIDCDRHCPSGCWKVALAVALNDDFHWYRQDDNDLWSHKPGQTAATNLDASGNPITDPRTADLDYSAVGGPDYKFCCCFCVRPPVTIAAYDGAKDSGEIAMRHPRPAVEVTAILFSGRNNPTWAMTREQIQGLRERIDSLPVTEPKPLAWLGYDLRNSGVRGLPDEITVHDGVVEITSRGRTSYHEDAKNLEAWLRDLALEGPEGGLIRQTLERRGRL